MRRRATREQGHADERTAGCRCCGRHGTARPEPARDTQPTYRDLGDHTESIQVDFDPTRVTFAQLLDVFWQDHDACRAAWSAQYRAILFFGSDEQRRVAAASAQRVAGARSRAIATEVAPLTRFWPAEDYHQKYELRRQHPLVDNVRALRFGTRPALDVMSRARCRDVPPARRLPPWRSNPQKSSCRARISKRRSGSSSTGWASA